MLSLMALVIFVVIIFSIGFARGAVGYRMVAFKPREQQEKFYKVNWIISLFSISLGFLLVVLFKDYSTLNFFDFALFFSCIPIAVLLIKSYKLQDWPFNVSLSENRIGNFIYMTIPVHCFYVMVLIQLFGTFANGAD
jgi:hypothetical protein